MDGIIPDTTRFRSRPGWRRWTQTLPTLAFVCSMSRALVLPVAVRHTQISKHNGASARSCSAGGHGQHTGRSPRRRHRRTAAGIGDSLWTTGEAFLRDSSRFSLPHFLRALCRPPRAVLHPPSLQSGMQAQSLSHFPHRPPTYFPSHSALPSPATGALARPHVRLHCLHLLPERDLLP